MESLVVSVPSALLVLASTAFVKLFTSLTILRTGLGLRGMGFGVVTVLLALVLALFIAEPYLGPGQSPGQLFAPDAYPEVSSRLRTFVDAHTDLLVLKKVEALRTRIASSTIAAAGLPSMQFPQDTTSPPKPAVSLKIAPSSDELLRLTAFLLSELRESFQIGALFLIPFVLVDLMVGVALLLLGTTQLPHYVIAFPAKLLLFLAVDGWMLISEQLLGGYLR